MAAEFAPEGMIYGSQELQDDEGRIYSKKEAIDLLTTNIHLLTGIFEELRTSEERDTIDELMMSLEAYNRSDESSELATRKLGYAGLNIMRKAA